MSEHLEMTDLKKQFESRALIAEDMLKDKETKLTELESLHKSTCQQLQDLQIEFDKLSFL